MNDQMMQTMLDLIKQGKNPEQLMIGYLQSLNTPIGNNLAKMAQEKNEQGLEQFARNMCSQYGYNFDTEFKAFKEKMGL